MWLGACVRSGRNGLFFGLFGLLESASRLFGGIWRPFLLGLDRKLWKQLRCAFFSSLGFRCCVLALLSLSLVITVFCVRRQCGEICNAFKKIGWKISCLEKPFWGTGCAKKCQRYLFELYKASESVTRTAIRQIHSSWALWSGETSSLR